MKKFSFRNICPNRLVNGGTWIPTQVCLAPGLSSLLQWSINTHTVELQDVWFQSYQTTDFLLMCAFQQMGRKMLTIFQAFFFPRVCCTRGLFILTVNLKVQFGVFQNIIISTEQTYQQSRMKRKRMLEPKRKAKASQEHQRQAHCSTRKH